MILPVRTLTIAHSCLLPGYRVLKLYGIFGEELQGASLLVHIAISSSRETGRKKNLLRRPSRTVRYPTHLAFCLTKKISIQFKGARDIFSRVQHFFKKIVKKIMTINVCQYIFKIRMKTKV